MAFGDFTVVRSTVKYVLGSNGLLQEVAVNTPAFEFNADGSYKGLLVEPAGTNIMLKSQELNDASWTKDRASVTANATTAPDGTLTADKLVEDATPSNTHQIFQINSLVAGSHTFSFFAKADTRHIVGVGRTNLDMDTGNGKFNLLLGTLVSGTGTIQPAGNGWFRCSTFVTVSVGTSASPIILLADGTGNLVYNGDGVSGVFLWGVKLETGSVATSYIHTEASTVTRTADNITLTGASSLIGQTSGWLYAKVNLRAYTTSVSRRIIDLFTDSNNRITLTYESSGALTGLIVTSGVVQAQIASSAITAGIYDIAIAYTLNDVVFFVNGVQIGTDTSAAIPATSIMGIGSGSGGTQLGDHVLAVANGKTRISNAELQAMTTL